MIFSEPIPFAEAIASREFKAILPTDLSSAQLSAIAPELRERAIFSARTNNHEYLVRVNEVLNRILNPDQVIDEVTGALRAARPGEFMDQATARLELKKTLIQTDYVPDPAVRGTIRDLSSDARLNLLIETNDRMALGYGQWTQGQDPAILDEWPAQELFRAEDRELPRNWIARWTGAGGTIFEGRMIAPKNDPIWTLISAFGLPYPPFDFNSGMDVQDIDRDEAVRLGVVSEDTQIEPETREFNDGIEASVDERQPALFQALMDSLGDTAEFVGGVLTLK